VCVYFILKVFVYYPTPNDISYTNTNFYVFDLTIPADLQFCGEKIPSNDFNIRKDLEKEFFTSAYWKNNSKVLFNKAQRWFPYIEPILKDEGVPDDFKYLCDPQYLELIKIPKESKWLNTNGDGDIMIYNNKYNFIFNHESPGHANLWISEQWTKGINHYITNNYEEFINKYKRRIQNIKDLLNSGKNINFILTRPNTEINDIKELSNTIQTKYPSLNFNFVLLNCDRSTVYDHLLLMKIDENHDEIKRLCI
jgi:hypothetical protein